MVGSLNMKFPKGDVYVTLSHAPNPDIVGIGYWDFVPTVKKKKALVTSWKEASQVCRDFISEQCLGGGNWTGGQITSGKSRTVIAHVSYNGRVWEGDKYPSAEIPI